MAVDASKPGREGAQLPLSGVRVLDISRFIAGPYAGQILGHLGADVVKIEQPGSGDPMRALSRHSNDLGSAHFLSGNASKRSVTLDLKTEGGRALLLRLVAASDVLIENFRPGVLDRLGIGHALLSETNPALVIGSITGFGHTGPMSNWASYDLIAQAVGGGMSLTGRPGEPVVKMGVPIGDVGASLYGVIGVLAALRNRDRTGRGDIVDISMMDVQVSLLNYHAHEYWLSDEDPGPQGDGHANIAPYQTFDTATRPLVVAVYGDPFWPGFCRALDSSDLEHDALFATNAARFSNRETLTAILQERFALRPQEHWLSKLVAEGVPAVPLYTVSEALNSQQTAAREMVVEAQRETGPVVRLLGSPIKFANAGTHVVAPPALGAHTEDILREWADLSEDDVAHLRASGAI